MNDNPIVTAGELHMAILGIDPTTPGAEADARAIYRRAIAADGEARAQQIAAEEAGRQRSALRLWLHRHYAAVARAAAARAAAEAELKAVRLRCQTILAARKGDGE